MIKQCFPERRPCPVHGVCRHPGGRDGENRIKAKAERDGRELSGNCVWNYSSPK
jgi:hypothetical protein